MAENQQQYEFYQIPHTGVEEPDRAAYTRTDTGTTIRRALDMRMSNFGALWVGKRRTTDYTKVDYGFEAKSQMEGAAEFGLHDLKALNLQDTRNENPLVWGSTVKYTWNDEMFKTGMDTDDSTLRAGGSKSKSYPVVLPKFDVMDTNLVDAAGINADRAATWQKNWPSEGWRTFGGKYDFLPYSGGGFTH